MTSSALALPPSKSHLIRALVAAALADGQSALALDATDLAIGIGASHPDEGPHLPRDAADALGTARGLGADCRLRGGRLIEIAPSAFSRQRQLHCGESALLMRLLLPIAAVLGGIDGLDGAGTLLARPIAPLCAPLEALGARFEGLAPGRALPIGICGQLRGGEISLDGSITSQLSSGLLMALPLCAAPSRLALANAASRPYLDLTIQVLRAFGVEIRQAPESNAFEIPGGQHYRGARINIEADWSAAAFPLVLGAVRRDAPPVVLRGLDRSARQGDRAIAPILRAIGADISWQGNLLCCGHRDLIAFDLSLRDAPDLLPPLAALALFCHGTSRLREIGRTRFKESDRPAALIGEFSKLGARIWREGEALCIEGGRLHGGRTSARGDHRIAMALAVAAAAQGIEIDIEGGRTAVEKSFPHFFEMLAALAAPQKV